MRGPSRLHVSLWALLIVVSLGSMVGSTASAQGPGASQGSQSAATNLGISPSVQVANTSFAATVGSDLTVRFNVTAYQPGTLHWLIFNGTGETAFLFAFQNVGGAVLPDGVTVAYPDGTSSDGNRSNVVAVLSFAPPAAGKTFKLQLAVWQASESDPQQPIAETETLTVTVGPAPQTSPVPLEIMGTAGAVALIVIGIGWWRWYRKDSYSQQGTARSPGKNEDGGLVSAHYCLDLLRQLAFDVRGPEHLGDVHGEEEDRQ